MKVTVKIPNKEYPYLAVWVGKDQHLTMEEVSQKTKSAKVAWKSTFPVAISYRQGDVGLSLVDEQGNAIESQSLFYQS